METTFAAGAANCPDFDIKIGACAAGAGHRCEICRGDETNHRLLHARNASLAGLVDQISFCVLSFVRRGDGQALSDGSMITMECRINY